MFTPRRLAAAAIICANLCSAAQPQTKAAPAPAAKWPATPKDDAQLYRNPTFGFRYRIPYGWVDRTQQMRAEQEKRQAANESDKSELLLAVFEHPPEATGNTINSAVVIASENTASYPGLKKAEDYLAPLTELATAQGFTAEGEPYALEVESRPLLRADFVKTIAVKTTNDRLTMRQCTLVWLAKRQIVSFTFIAGSEDELDDLMDGLHFAVARSPAP